MYVKKRYGFLMTLNWSKEPFIIGIIYGLIVSLISYYSHIKLAIPWGPLGVIGIAVAFYLGFKNNSSYDRTWEARKIWGSIVNNSRTFGAASLAFVQGKNDKEIQKELIYRHIAWLTILRYQLRLSKEWEHFEKRIRGLYSPNVDEHYNHQLKSQLSHFISKNEIESLFATSNRATQILKIQAIRLQELKDLGYYEDFRHMEFHKLITSFFEDQGKSERIKNFPFPRQYASVAVWITFVFCALIPFGILDAFKSAGEQMLWICPFFTGLITWIFFLMEKIGDYSENPFEGTYNDIPITSIARSIEIDLREMLNDSDIPKPINPENGFLM